MNERRQEKIERLERRVLKASRVTTTELREIVDAPMLFDRINARIKAEKAATGTTAKVPFLQRRRFSFWNMPKIGLAFGALVVLLFGAFTSFFFPKADFSQAAASVTTPLIENPNERAEPIDPDENSAAENPATDIKASPEKVALKTKVSRAAERRELTPKIKAPRSTVDETEPEEAFSPLAFDENLDEAREAGQVIRVELSRSSLLALGVDPPTEDENLKVKTDLLIGSDGVARGIRFVK